MRKTNNKELKANVRRYLLTNEELTIIEIKEKFINEYGWAIPRYGELNACIEWLRGLPLSVAFYYDDIANVLADWLEDTRENQLKWIEKKGDNLYWLLLAREIVASK